MTDSNSYWRQYTVTFPVAIPGSLYENNTAYGDYYQTLRAGKAPLAILVHGWGDHSTIPMRMLARGLARKGIHAFVLYLPFHSRRLPPEMKERAPNFTPEEWFTGYRVAVTDVRKILDWAQIVTEIDASRIALVGLSLGAFVGAIAMGIDERINAGVFIVSGGNSSKIQQFSRFSAFRRRYRVSAAEYEEYQVKYKQYLEEIAVQGWENVTPSRQYFLIDPLTYAGRLKGRRLLMINALWDELIPRVAARDFQRACAPCETMWLPASHTTIWLLYPLVASRIERFLRTVFHAG
ncbi:MAG: alpha/beta fold hydrolase [Dehalococcoidia bacterium]|nr:alpha/beta fold hydrolase [Dehalococcoidia bacterium]